ncbi:MAG TPA: PAS domain S-box protein, partial [Bryobacteraceae bacterium]|nr:PAS domain S-box protein [Bryobacteraceae bacterium]
MSSGPHSSPELPESDRLRQQILLLRQEIADLRSTLAGSAGTSQTRAIRESAFAARQRLASEALSMGAWEWDIGGDRFTWSDEFRALHGIAHDVEPTYEHWLQVIYPDDRDAFAQALAAAIRNERPLDAQYRVTMATGEKRSFSVKGRAIFDDRGAPVSIMGMSIDVTDRERAEQDLLEMASIVQSSDDAIIGKTLEGIITSWNPGAEQIFGYSAEEAIGQPVSMLAAPGH